MEWGVVVAKKRHKRDQFKECFSELDEKWLELRTKTMARQRMG